MNSSVILGVLFGAGLVALLIVQQMRELSSDGHWVQSRRYRLAQGVLSVGFLSSIAIELAGFVL
jgi:hypothetical protein